MQQLYQELANKLADENVILATVISSKGSTPREVGAKMLITQAGEIIGTIGGGAGEAKVYDAAQSIFKNYEDELINKSDISVQRIIPKQIIEINLSGAKNYPTEGVCGGRMQILLELWTRNEYLDLAQQIVQLFSVSSCIDDNKDFLRHVQHDCQSSFINQNHQISQAIVTPVFATQKPYLSTHFSANSPYLETDKFIEPIITNPTLFIIGAGHVAVPLARIAAMSSFRVIVQDDRCEFANFQRFPDAFKVFANPLDALVSVISHLSKTTDLYIALVTRGYLQDIAALKLILPYQPKYIGMIGSQKRVQTVFKKLSAEEGCDELKINLQNPIQKIYAPIGLDIGALTPEEIAVSICAELIKIRRGGTGLSLSFKSSGEKSGFEDKF